MPLTMSLSVCHHCKRGFARRSRQQLHCRKCHGRARECQGCGLRRVLRLGLCRDCSRLPPAPVFRGAPTCKAYLNDPDRLARIAAYTIRAAARLPLFEGVAS